LDINTKSTYIILKISKLLQIQLIFVILLSLLVINLKGWCSSVEMPKGFMVREKLGIPVINEQNILRGPTKSVYVGEVTIQPKPK